MDKILSEPPKGDLCPFCKWKIEFDLKQFYEEKTIGSSEFRLGLLEEVKSRSHHCPFCWLVAAAIDEDNLYPNLPITCDYDSYDHFYIRVRSGVSRKRICFMSEESGKRKHVDNDEIDMEIIHTWTSNCQTHHGHHCAPPATGTAEEEIPHFRLIDVERLCVVNSSIREIYLALSYLWGRVSTFHLLRSNKEELSFTGGLKRYWNQLPMTIKDAITFTQKLGQRYLWIDSLCLVQDDEQDLMGGIRMMDKVYEQSFLTIVAASGVDATAGLPGVRKGTRTTQQIVVEVSHGIKMILLHRLEYILKLSRYDRRAWTFQEYQLSRRKVIFTDNMVYFVCRRRKDWAENVKNSILDLGQLKGVAVEDFLHDYGPYVTFANILQTCSGRGMSDPKDCLKAVAGICRRFSEHMRCPFVEGFPAAAIDLYLPFFFPEGTYTTRREGYPSYSWAGWTGRIKYLGKHFRSRLQWIKENTWIIWYTRSPSGVVTQLWEPRESEVAEQAKFREPKPFSNHEFYQFFGIDTTQTIPTGNFPCRSYFLLQFWTMTAFFKISTDGNPRPEICEWVLLDKYNMICGWVKFDTDPSNWRSGQMVELVLLSKRGYHDRAHDPDFSRPTSHYSDGNYYFAMVVLWEDGVAERRGMGEISCERVSFSFPPGPQWKEILLG